MKKNILTAAILLLSFPLFATTIIAKGRLKEGAPGIWAICDPSFANEICNVYVVQDNLTDTIYCLSYVPEPILINGHVVKEYNPNGQLIWQGNVQRIERSVVGADVKYLIVQ
jgi:hypothetical protein